MTFESYCFRITVYFKEGEVFKILAQTHKTIALEVYDKIEKNYNIKLDIKKLSWGSIAPDYLPYYKLIRHYKKESLDYIANEIVKLIFLCRYSSLDEEINPVLLKYVSKKMGVISHYLCDYTCYPHAYRKTFMGSMKSHIKYEADLNQYAIGYEFIKDITKTQKIDLYEDSNLKLVEKIKDYINSVVDEYMNAERSFDTDLNYALDLSQNIACFIVETVLNYSEDMEYQFV
nr:zinc dependent phospholipase C family protein [Peptoniphilus stercorisuis]